eukprot:75429-Rhodomonas_salina.1
MMYCRNPTQETAFSVQIVSGMRLGADLLLANMMALGPGPALVTVECAKCGEPYCSVTCRDKAAAAHARHCPANPL